MTDTTYPLARITPGPLHSILLGGTVALFLGALSSDIAYARTYQIQWSNFASWLIAGGLVFCGLALLFALANLLRAQPKAGRPALYFLLLLITWVLGLVNAFKHSQDAWSSVGAFGLILSILCTILVLVAGWTAYAARESVR